MKIISKYISTLLLVILVGLGSIITAQSISVKGEISDQNSDVIIGANIIVKGTSFGTISDLDGRFTIDCNIGDVLVFSFIGFDTEEVEITKNNYLHVILPEEPKLTGDGYSTQARHNFTYLYNVDNNLQMIEYMRSFRKYSSDEIGRKRHHAITNHINVGINYYQKNEDIVYLFEQLNYSKYIYQFVLKPYVNIGPEYYFDSENVKFRTDSGLSVGRLSNRFYISVDTRVVSVFYNPKFYLGLGLTRTVSYQTGWNW
jgi:hypothetical protein